MLSEQVLSENLTIENLRRRRQLPVCLLALSLLWLIASQSGLYAR